MSPAARLQPAVLTGRERQVAALIAEGRSNREIAGLLGISERTAGTHVQNILNKLGLDNRVQIATWWAHEGVAGRPAVPTAVEAVRPAAAMRVPGQSLTRAWTRVLLGLWCGAILVAAASDGALPSALSSALQLLPGGLPLSPGPLMYQAQLTGGTNEFGPPFISGDPTASQIRLVKGAVEFAVLKRGGSAQIEPVMPVLRAYFGQTRLSVRANSLVEFWFGLTQGDPDRNIGSYLIDVNTYAETIQLGYYLQDAGVTWLSPRVAVQGLQSERAFWVSALVQPPRFEIFLDNRKVIDTKRAPNVEFQAPTFRISGDAGGLVRMTALAFYELK